MLHRPKARLDDLLIPLQLALEIVSHGIVSLWSFHVINVAIAAINLLDNWRLILLEDVHIKINVDVTR